MPLQPLKARAPRSVRFVERFVDDDELAAVFQRADIIVLPYRQTRRFDQSGVLAAALAFGKAMVLSDVGSFSEIAGSGAATLVAPEDAAALRDAMGRLLEDPQQRAQLGAAARRLASGPYSWREAAQRTLTLYRALAG
jgi:glycosyltransferase involved in cell wall biosynthesis